MIGTMNEFKSREPIFQHPEFGTTRQDFEKLTDPFFYVIDAYGQRYSREQAINIAARWYENSSYRGVYSWPEDSWEIKKFEWHRIEYDVFLVTYILARENQATHRTSIWQRSQNIWKVKFHQATVINKGIQCGSLCSF